MTDTTLQIIVIYNDYCQHGSAVLYDNNGQKFKEEKGSFLNEMNIIDLSTTLNTFEGIKVSINWEATND